MLKFDIKSGVYNLVTENTSINKIVLQLKDILPDLDILYFNQHINFNSIKVRPIPKIAGRINVKQISIVDSLKKLKQRFEF